MSLSGGRESPKEAAGRLKEPRRDCALCPRLAAYRCANRARNPNWHNAPVSSFGPLCARLLIVGLAPGLKGANRTGRPFTGDGAGELLYPTLRDFRFAAGVYEAREDDGLRLLDCRITNAVRCVPPENKPRRDELNACRDFLASEIEAMPRLEALLALGHTAHGAILKALGLKNAFARFRHGAFHRLDRATWLADSYHCSRYNTQTGRLSEAMFREVFAGLRARLGPPPAERTLSG